MALHDNPKKSRISGHRNIIIASIVIGTILVNGCFFPIVNLNRENPVDIGLAMCLIVAVMALAFHKGIGSFEAVAFPKWPIAFVGIFNFVLVLIGLGCRYLLEFGEVSNTYNFTAVNVAFQVLVLVLVSTIVCALDRLKPLEER